MVFSVRNEGIAYYLCTVADSGDMANITVISVKWCVVIYKVSVLFHNIVLFGVLAATRSNLEPVEAEWHTRKGQEEGRRSPILIFLLLAIVAYTQTCTCVDN